MLARLLTRSIVVCALFSLIVSVAMVAQGPYPRIRVIEEWTSATCGPCIQATPVIDANTILDSGVVSIRYHMDFPAPNDPWNLYNPGEPIQRFLYYDGSGNLGIPAANANGTAMLDPRPAFQGSTFTANVKNAARTSPIQITVTQNGGKIKVRVRSDIALKSHKLQVVLLSRYAYVPTIGQLMGGSPSNGETEFRDIMHKMYPDHNGTILDIAAGGDQTLEFPASITSSTLVFPLGQQYAIAFVQSNATKDILQGGVSADMTASPRTFTFFNRSQVEMATTNPYQRVGRGETTEVDVTVTNKGTAPATADFVISNAAELAAPLVNSSAQFSTPSVTLAPNESKVVKLQVTGSATRSSFFSVNPGVTASDGLGIGANSVYYLVEGGRVVTYFGLNNATWVHTTQAAINSSYSTDVVYMPFSSVLQTAYPVTDFDAAVFAFDLGSVTGIQGAAFTAMQAMEASGKGLWIAGQYNMRSTFDAAAPFNGGNTAFQPVRDFFKNKLGIDYAGYRVRATQANGQITVRSFAATGVADDSIGGGIARFMANQISNQWQNFVGYSDIMRLTPTSQAKPWLYYSDSVNAIGGVHISTPTGARLVYTSLELASAINATTRNQVAEQIMSWILMKGPSLTPILTLTNTSLQYGNVEIDKTKDMTLPIRNTGTAPLIITNMIVEGTDALAFEVTTGGTASGDVTIAPNATHNVTVRFAPTMAKTNYIASLTFASNAPINPNAQLRGGGVTSSVETDVVSETGAIGLRLMGANPVTDASEVELRSLTNTTVTIVDQAGREMSTIFSGNAAGTQRVALQTSTLPAGTYNVVASNGSERAVLSIVVVR